MNDTSDVTETEQYKLLVTAMRFVTQYSKQNEEGNNEVKLSVENLDLAISNLIFLTKFLYEAVSKLIDIELAKGCEISSVKSNVSELNNVLRGLYS